MVTCRFFDAGANGAGPAAGVISARLASGGARVLRGKRSPPILRALPQTGPFGAGVRVGAGVCTCRSRRVWFQIIRSIDFISAVP